MIDSSNVLIKDMYSDKPDVLLTVKNAAGSNQVELWYSPIPKYKSTNIIEKNADGENSDSYERLILSSRKIGLAVLSLGLSKASDRLQS